MLEEFAVGFRLGDGSGKAPTHTKHESFALLFISGLSSFPSDLHIPLLSCHPAAHELSMRLIRPGLTHSKDIRFAGTCCLLL